MKTKLFSALLIMALVLASVAAVASAAPAAGDEPDLAGQIDNRMDPATARQAELKEKAMAAVLNGKAGGPTHEVAKGQYVELDWKS